MGASQYIVKYRPPKIHPGVHIISLKYATVKDFSRIKMKIKNSGISIGYMVYQTTTEMNKSITRESFEEDVIRNINLSLVQFKTEWSGACQIVSAMYDVLELSYKGLVNFYSVDMETEHALTAEYGITEMPTILFFSKGQIVDHAVGMIPKNVLISKIENAIASRDN